MSSPFNFPKCSNCPLSLNDCVWLMSSSVCFIVERIWISIESNLISLFLFLLFQFCILWGVANSIKISMHGLKGSAFLNWQFCPTLLKHSKNMEIYFFFFFRHIRNESHFGLLSLLVIRLNHTWTKGLFKYITDMTDLREDPVCCVMFWSL